jgi:hypothetical protein
LFLKLSNWILVVAAICLVFVTAAATYKPASDVQTYWATVARALEPWNALLTAVLVAITAGIPLVQTSTRSPKKWAVIHDILNEAREEIFSGVAGPEHEHRLTLFCWKYSLLTSPFFLLKWWKTRKKFPPIHSLYLLPRCRSGKHTQDTKVAFLIRNENDFEGVAGKCWFNRSTTRIQNLKNPATMKNGPEAALSLYAKKTYIAPSYVQQKIDRNCALPKAMVAVPVDVEGQEWGVLLIDSTQPTIDKIDPDWENKLARISKEISRHLQT